MPNKAKTVDSVPVQPVEFILVSICGSNPWFLGISCVILQPVPGVRQNESGWLTALLGKQAHLLGWIHNVSVLLRASLISNSVWFWYYYVSLVKLCVNRAFAKLSLFSVLLSDHKIVTTIINDTLISTSLIFLMVRIIICMLLQNLHMGILILKCYCKIFMPPAFHMAIP